MAGLAWQSAPRGSCLVKSQSAEHAACLPWETLSRLHRTHKLLHFHPPLAHNNQKRELNPYLRDGGSGVPPEAEGGAAPGAAQRATGVGDGGASWRLKALKRAQQQAEAEVRFRQG